MALIKYKSIKYKNMEVMAVPEASHYLELTEHSLCPHSETGPHYLCYPIGMGANRFSLISQDTGIALCHVLVLVSSWVDVQKGKILFYAHCLKTRNHI